MRWGYIVGTGQRPVPLQLPVETHCHALLTGSSGSGKSYALLILLGNILQSNPDIVITFCDFKNSEDFAFMKGYANYYSGDNCYTGIMTYYNNFCVAREQGHKEVRHLLVCDEYPAMVNRLTMLDKSNKTKRANDILSAISEILMLGRGTGGGFGLWIITQVPSSTLFEGSSRQNFMCITSLGRLSKEHQHMLFSGEKLPDKIYRKGEGVLLADGHPLYEIAFPKIQSVVIWKKHIKEILMKNCR